MPFFWSLPSDQFKSEEKWIKNEISRDTYDRWYSTYNHNIVSLKADIERLGKDHAKAFDILNKHLSLLTDMKGIHKWCSITI